MRCSICGAKLKKEGDICTNCYKEYQEEEELKKDTNVKLKLERKYSFQYEFFKYFGVLLIAILAMVLCFFAGGILEGLLVLVIYIALMVALLYLDRKIANATHVTFYEKKAVYTFKFLFFNTEKVVKYSDLKDVSYFQTLKQRKFGYGDICIYTKGIPGVSFFKGIQIKNVENVKEVLKQIGEIVETIE